MSHSFAGCASMARFTFRTSARRTNSQRWVRRRLAHLLRRSPSSAGGTHWSTDRTSRRGAPLHPGADQAPRNLRRPSGHRHRERAAVPRTQGVAWSSRQRQVKFLGVIASSPTDIQPVLDAIAESAARLCDATTRSIYRVDGDISSLRGTLRIHADPTDSSRINRVAYAGRSRLARSANDSHP